MNLVFSSAAGWAVALAIAAPIIALFWWARRHAPVGSYEADYSVGRRSQTPTEHAAGGLVAGAPVAPDAPVASNPAALAPPAESVTPPATIVNLPVQAPKPPEAAGAVTAESAAPEASRRPDPRTPDSAPNLEPTTAVQTPGVIPAPTAPAAVVKPATAPQPVSTPLPGAAPKPLEPKALEPERDPLPLAPVAKPFAPPIPTPVAPTPPEPVTKALAASKPTADLATAEPATPELASVTADSSEPPAEPAQPSPPAASTIDEPTGESDDFSRLYGIDSAAGAALQAAGIRTYRQLAGANVDLLREIVSGVGQPDTDPATWPQQGRFAAGGKWKQLESRFQKKG